MSITMKKIGNNINSIMDSKNITQTELSKKTGMTQANISNIINAKTNDIKLTTLNKLAEGLGVKVEDIMFYLN